MKRRYGGAEKRKSTFVAVVLALLLFMTAIPGCGASSTSTALQQPKQSASPEQTHPASGDENLAATPAPSSGAFELNVPIYRVEPRAKDVVNILLIGTDSRAVRGNAVGGNADTIILASFNQTTRIVTLVSFMRDAVVIIDTEYGKLKTAYRMGGTGLLINTLNRYFSLDIQGYVAIGLDGFATLVEETLGGLDVELDQLEIDEINRRITEYENEIACIRNCPLITDAPGKVHLNGAQTLAFVRNRSTPSGGGTEASDYDRASRQQEVLRLMYETLAAQEPLTAVPGLIAFALKHVETNLSADALYSLAEPLLTESVAIKSVSAPFDGTWEYGGDGSGILFDRDATILLLHERLYGIESNETKERDKTQP